MNELPYDVTLLIFEAYVHGFRRSPASLLTVCHRWKQFLLASPTLWTRVVISVDSIDYVPRMLESEMYGLEAYLSRSEGVGRDVPLDIEIRWLEPKDIELDHVSTCGLSSLDVDDCPETPCKLILLGRRQLHDIFAILFRMDRNNSDFQTRSNRWVTLELDMSHFYTGQLSGSLDVVLPSTPLLPNLHTMILRDISIGYPPSHLPNLKRLELSGSSSFTNSPPISNIQILRTDEPISASRPMGFPWKTSPVEILEVNRFDDETVDSENPLPALTTLIFECSRNIYINWGAVGKRFNTTSPLRTVILLRITIFGLDTLLQYVPNLRIQMWKLSCSCYRRSPNDIIPSYYTKTAHCEKTVKEVNAARSFLNVLKHHGMQAEGLDTCTTRLFDEALRSEVLAIHP